jgi:hypothetical protein
MRRDAVRNPPSRAPTIGPAQPGVRYQREECPDSDICETTRRFLLDLQRRKQFLSQDDANRALGIEFGLLKRHRRRLVVDPRGPAWEKWLMERRMEAFDRLKRFASRVQWLPTPRL